MYVARQQFPLAAAANEIYVYFEILLMLPQLAMATLGATFGIPWALTRGGGSKQTNTPPINAGSKDEEKFIQ